MIKFKRIESDIERRLERLADVFRRHPEVVVTYLFGSYATGEQQPLSDVDIAYLFTSDAYRADDRLYRDLQIDAEVSEALGTDEVDCKLLNKAPLPFQHEVITKGRRIYCRDKARADAYENEVKADYQPSLAS